ncbi:MAG TPA: MotA/TolQ/ExbB proton channel family protein [Planctomycetaceae bacterium]|nr:MotA/TolQ/ExbB proton channel family protein [Planctomycetaceae bacterium]
MTDTLSQFRHRGLLTLILAMLAAFALNGSSAYGQDDLADLLGDEAEVTEPVDGGDGRAADADNGGGQPANDGGAGGSEDEPENTAPKNLLAWTFQALGWVYTLIFFALSITLLTLVVMNIIASRQDNVCPIDLVEGVEQQLTESNPAGAAELIRTDDSFLGQVVAAGLAKLDKGHSHAVEAMQEVGEEETMKMEHNLSYMALIGNISPMIGLFGTVQGMISAFRTIATSGTTPKPSELAMDISTALFTTLAGLAVAIPAIAVYNILRNRVQRLTMQVGVTSEELIERFQG